jgi:hypothetical protein
MPKFHGRYYSCKIPAHLPASKNELYETVQMVKFIEVAAARAAPEIHFK